MGSDYPAWASREGELQIQQTGTIGIFGAKHMGEPETELMTAGRLGSRGTTWGTLWLLSRFKALT